MHTLNYLTITSEERTKFSDEWQFGFAFFAVIKIYDTFGIIWTSLDVSEHTYDNIYNYSISNFF